MNSAFSRVERLLGANSLAQLTRARVILFGVGGVGGWCAEALVRSGIGHLTLIDPDCVDVTNINRQLPATTATVGQPKV
jgi:tRNA A37 threonylcarbamoyladenosine dehydratase